MSDDEEMDIDWIAEQADAVSDSVDSVDIGHRLAFLVRGIPRARARHRHNAHTGKVYRDETSASNAWMKKVRKTCLDALAVDTAPEVPLIGKGLPVSVSWKAVFPRPASHYVANDVDRGELKKGAPDMHTQKPDRDNLEKALLDALGAWPKGHRPIMWHDDSQACQGQGSKIWGDEAGMIVTIESIDVPMVLVPRK